MVFSGSGSLAPPENHVTKRRPFAVFSIPGIPCQILGFNPVKLSGGKPTAAESIVLEFIFTEIECRSELPGLNPLFSKKRVYRNLDLRPFKHDY
jgi:hypothetical protein